LSAPDWRIELGHGVQSSGEQEILWRSAASLRHGLGFRGLLEGLTRFQRQRHEGFQWGRSGADADD
jgi:hypothetical protein